MKLPAPFEGLIAAPFTPFHADGRLNLSPIRHYAKHLATDGVRGAFIGGTTGEGASLSTVERQRVTEAWCRHRPASLAVIVHVGHNAASDSRVLACHAQDAGADAIAALAPSFFRPGDLDALVDWCGFVAAAAPRLPFYYYHMPSMTGVDFPMARFHAEAVRRLPTYAGIKFTHGDLVDFADTLALAVDRRSVLAGRDEFLLAYLALGARGAVGSTYNYASPLYQRLLSAFDANDLPAARRWQAAARTLIHCLNRHGGLPANKAIMGLVSGIDCGPVRAPLRPLSRAAQVRLRRDLHATAFHPALAAARRA
ncbi:MAG: dihydrodipicolinate synthase family protein [Opitutaceae bacterium]|nr:dihydrodipicolinate synthase family protein [Opitutaceae bacterium]